jgi:hypothetical protein
LGRRPKARAASSAQNGEASGVGLRQEIADAYVVMRLAELVAEQRIGAVVEAAVAMCGGNRPTGSNYRWGPVRRCFRINDLALASPTGFEPVF